MLDLFADAEPSAGVARAGGDDPETLRAFPRGGAVRRH